MQTLVRLFALPALVSFFIVLQIAYEKIAGQFPDLADKKEITWPGFLHVWLLFLAAYIMLFVFLQSGKKRRDTNASFRKQGAKGSAASGNFRHETRTAPGTDEAIHTIEFSPGDIEPPPEERPHRLIDVLQENTTVKEPRGGEDRQPGVKTKTAKKTVKRPKKENKRKT